MVDQVMNMNVDIILSILESGNLVELTASGYSMFPTLRQGDRIVVKRLRKEELPVPGQVVVCLENSLTEQSKKGITAIHNNDRLVLHRLIEIIEDESGNPMLVTRGDSVVKPDKPWFLQQIIGTAETYKRDKKEYPIKTISPGILRYAFYHNLACLVIISMRLRNGLRKLR
jgi:signal peptidase I